MITKETINGIDIIVNEPSYNQITIGSAVFHKNSWNEIKNTIDKMLIIVEDEETRE